MRGFGKHGRDAVPPSAAAITSYEQALYPPRAYRVHHQPTATRADALVLPSIAADTVCEPRPEAVRTTGFRAAAEEPGPAPPRPPAAAAYLSCFVPSPAEAFAFDMAEALAEPLNALHYAEVVGAGGARLRGVMAAAGVPLELLLPAPELTGIGSSVPLTTPAAQRRALAVRAHRLPPPPRPVRRGGKVSMPEAPPPPGRGHPGDDGSGSKRRRTEGEEDGSGSQAEDSEELSVSLHRSDDDDDNVEGFSGGSDRDDDAFF